MTQTLLLGHELKAEWRLRVIHERKNVLLFLWAIYVKCYQLGFLQKHVEFRLRFE